jgi:hypothetical protein
MSCVIADCWSEECGTVGVNIGASCVVDRVLASAVNAFHNSNKPVNATKIYALTHLQRKMIICSETVNKMILWHFKILL